MPASAYDPHETERMRELHGARRRSSSIWRSAS
jgi:hypothetical protein